MIIQPTIREDGYYEMGEEFNDSITVWAAYYHSTQTVILTTQITNDPAYHIEGILEDGFIGVGSDTSRQELIDLPFVRG